MNYMLRKISFISIFIILLLLSFSGAAQTLHKQDVKLAYDVSFDMNFDNRVFYRSGFSNSMTIFGARLTPSVGFSVSQSRNIQHKVMLGIDIMKDFGSSPVSVSIAGDSSPETSEALTNKALFREMLLYYRLDRKSGNNRFLLNAGIFPRSEMKEYYSEAFYSDSLRFYDNNLEGLLMRLERPAASFELGCDWMGQYGTDRRERFMVFSAGHGAVTSFLSMGYAAYMYHFASSDKVHGVVDNVLVNPYMKFDFAHMAGLQCCHLRLGWLQSMQNDRVHVGHYVYPYGGEVDMEVRKWNVGLRNDIFIGTDMMPYYNSHDAGGYKYGSRLYMGDPFYRVYDNAKGGIGTYDRFEAYYEPEIGSYLKLRIRAVFHFNNMKYSGTQQMVQLRFDLQELMKRTNKRI